MVKADTALFPFVELGDDILCDKYGVFGAANQLVVFRLTFGGNERENCLAIRGRYRHPTAARLIALIDDEAKSKLVYVESQASVLITDEDIDTQNAQVWILPIQAQTPRW